MPDKALPVIGSVASGVMGSQASDDAADAQMAAANKASETQKYMYDTSRKDLEPYRNTGTAANRKLSALMGLGEFDREAIRTNIRSQNPALFPAKQQQAAAPAADMQAYAMMGSVAGGMNGQKMASLARTRMNDPEYMGALSKYLQMQPKAMPLDALNFTPENLKHYTGGSAYGA